MAIALVNSATSEPVNPGGTTLTTGTFSASSGNCIVVHIRTSNGLSPTLTSVTDTAGNTYTVVSDRTGDPFMFCAVATNITGNSANAVSANFDAIVTYAWLWVGEYSGIATTTPIDLQTTTHVGGSQTDLTIGPFSTAVAGELVSVSASVNNNATPFTEGVDFSPDRVDLGFIGQKSGIVEHYIPAGTLSSYTAHATSPVSGNYGMCLIALKPAAGGGGGATPAATWSLGMVGAM